MNTPNIRYYARLVNTTGGNKTFKYTIVAAAGYYPPMNGFRGRDGKITMYLQQKLKEGLHIPAYWLQVGRSLNFTGLKEFFVDGRLSGFAYGYPFDKPTYSKDNKPNPFYPYKDDGFLFIIHGDSKAPSNIVSIELMVLARARPLIADYCKMLQMGGFNEVLELLRKQATGENDM
jgi:hypothetical protein